MACLNEVGRSQISRHKGGGSEQVESENRKKEALIQRLTEGGKFNNSSSGDKKAPE